MSPPDEREPEKFCCTCREGKPLSAYNRLKRAPDGRQPSCRECNREYHRKHWASHMEQIRRRKGREVEIAQVRILEHLSRHLCTDCGEDDVVVLEFDHLRDKTASVGALVSGGYSWRRIMEEIAKCEVVCANCHRRRTFARVDIYRVRLRPTPEAGSRVGRPGLEPGTTTA